MISLIKIWQTTKNELIGIIKNPDNIFPENTSRELKSDFRQGFNTGNFKYIHVIASMQLYNLLDDASKKIVSNPKFILCENNLFEGLKEIGFNNIFDDNISENPFYDYIVEKFEMDYPDELNVFADEQIKLMYILKIYSQEMDKKFNDKNFKLYCLYASSLDEFNELFDYNVDEFNNVICDRIKMIVYSKKSIIVTFLKKHKIEQRNIFRVINILEKYNWREIKIINKYIGNFTNNDLMKMLIKIGTIKKGEVLLVLDKYDIFMKMAHENYVVNVYPIDLLKIIITLYKFKTVEDMFSIFEFIVLFSQLVENTIEDIHIELINQFLGTFRDFISCIIPGVNQYSINLENKLKYLKILMPADIDLRGMCSGQFKTIMKFCFIDNLEPVLDQFKVLLFDERTDLSCIEPNYVNDCLILLISSNNILKYDINKIIPYSDLYQNVEEEYNPLSKIAKILLFCKHNKYNIEDTIKLKVNLLTVSTSKNYVKIIDKLNIQENNININENMLNAYAAGIDVHNGDRDNKTSILVDRLIKLYPLENVEIDLYFNQFWTYKNKFTEEKLKIIYRVLGVDKDLVETENPNQNYYKGFLNYTYSVKEKVYSARHIIAVFWKFANVFKDPTCLTNQDEDCIERDRENIKLGIFQGLMDALVEGNRLICPPGKLQRLAAATIQGRIKGENGRFLYIDDHLEEVVIVPKENGYITNLNDIHTHLRVFGKFLEQSNRPQNIEEFFYEFFICLENIDARLNYSYAIYYAIMMTQNIDGLVIDPGLSLTANYDDMFNIEDYIAKYLPQEKIEYDLANPQIVEARERRRLQNLANAEKNKNRVNAIFARKENKERNEMNDEDFRY